MPSLWKGLVALMVFWGLATASPLLAQEAKPPAKSNETKPASTAEVSKPPKPRQIGCKSKKIPEQKIDLNTASWEILQTLPCVGPKIAKKIIDNRPYAHLDDLQALPRMKNRLSRFREYAFVSPAAPKANKSVPAETKKETKPANP